MSAPLTPMEYVEAAHEHGQASGRDHEVSDLQVMLEAALQMFTPEQMQRFHNLSEVQAVLDGLEDAS